MKIKKPKEYLKVLIIESWTLVWTEGFEELFRLMIDWFLNPRGIGFLLFLKKYEFEGEPKKSSHFLGIFDFVEMTFCLV